MLQKRDQIAEMLVLKAIQILFKTILVKFKLMMVTPETQTLS